MLRVEPGVSDYDWLVENYNEHQSKIQRTPNLTEGVTGTDTTTHNTAISVHGTDVASGSDSVQGTGTLTHAIDKTTSKTDGGQDSHTKTGTETHTANYTQTDNINETEGADPLSQPTKTRTTTHPGLTIRTETSLDTEHRENNGSQAVHLDKDNPMSISYPLGQTGQGAEWGRGENPSASALTPGLDWTAPSAQSEDNSKNSGYSRDTADPTKNYNSRTETYSGLDSVQEIESGNKKKTGINTKATAGTTDGVTHNTTDTDVYGKTETVKESGTTDTETRNTTDTTLYGKTNTNDSVTNHSGTDSVQQNSTKTISGQENTVLRERYTGRTTAPAELLEKAVQFIGHTNAWTFLYGELNKCFMGVY